jgi:hypothetical protein
VGTLEAVNAFVDRVYRALTVGEGRPVRALDYVVTKTTLRAGEYGAAPQGLVEALGVTAAANARAGGLAVVRCTVMDPFLVTRRGRTDYVQDFVATLRRVVEAVLPAD